MTSETPTMHERMLACDPYIADDPRLAKASYVARERMAAYNSTPDADNDRKRAPAGQALQPPLFNI